ncbi:hypothetical protein CC86DRAFT_434332 [Ophiobolus disseminans]|uniref:Uncharacterized protein n=1 Tax=Ophiobolus disseminans TaxID=1469910 RepID=A0A6A7ACY6_9PLEO|nr:hypothetical protein CC86DRAFT_434332 [Ophiobolus disseminans]
MSNFSSLSRAQKLDLILAEEPTDHVQITMSPYAVDALLAALAATPKNELGSYGYNTAASLSLIADNWGIDDITTFPPDHHKRNFRPTGAWGERMLALLAILSEFTQGQGVYMGTLVCYAVELRVGNGRGPGSDLVVKEADIKRVIKDVLDPLRDPVDPAVQAAQEQEVQHRGAVWRCRPIEELGVRRTSKKVVLYDGLTDSGADNSTRRQDSKMKMIRT